MSAGVPDVTEVHSIACTRAPSVVHLVSCPACIHLPVKNGLVNKVELLGIILVCIVTCFIDTVNYAFMI